MKACSRNVHVLLVRTGGMRERRHIGASFPFSCSRAGVYFLAALLVILVSAANAARGVVFLLPERRGQSERPSCLFRSRCTLRGEFKWT
jgi:hypothetical protein